MTNPSLQDESSFQWKNRTTFIVVMIGATLSMKDFLVFPVMAAENGGGAFIFLYALFLLLMGLPLLLAELFVGRQTGGPLFAGLSEKYKCSKHWNWIISLSILASILILAVYNVIASWSLSFFVKTAIGVFDGVSTEMVRASLNSFQQDPERMMLWHTLFVVILFGISAQGIKLGLQRALSLLVPLMLILLMIGLAYSIAYGDYLSSVKYLLVPDFSKINMNVALLAMERAFYTLSLGLGVFLIIGSKLTTSVSLVYSGFVIVLIDLLFSILAGLAINSLVFTLDVMPNLTDEVAFSLLPIVFASLPMGQFFGALFYVLLSLAALTTAIILLEVLVTYLKQKYGLSRIRASVYAAVLSWIIGVFAILSYTVWADSGFSLEIVAAGNAFRVIDDAGFQDVLIYLASHLLQPLVALLLILFVAFVIPRGELLVVLGFKSKQVSNIVYFVIRFVAPTLVFVVWLSTLGVIRYA